MGTSPVVHDRSGSARRVPGRIPAHMVGAAPGWYYDPEDQAIYRWFDGDNWTVHLSDIFTSESPVEGSTDPAN